MDIQKLIDDYSIWLKNEITVEQIGEYYEITTPYLDSSNDYLQIYIKQNGDNFILSDDSNTINKLYSMGLKLTKNRKEHLNRILLQYGVQLNKNELVANVPINEFAKRKHMFVQAMLKIDDMFIINKSNVSSLFIEDIQSFFAKKDIFYSENVQFTGVSGFVHNYDFLLQRSKTKPERLCTAVNSPSKSTVSSILFAWDDTKPSRKDDSKLVILLNDENNIPRGVEMAFNKYEAKVIKWSERDKNVNIDYLSA